MKLPATSSILLKIWDQGSHLHPVDRALFLVTQARMDIPVDIVADLSLGFINKSLIQMQLELFGHQMSAIVRCSNCHESLELSLDLHRILQQLPDLENEALYSSCIHFNDYRFRLPNSRDLAFIYQQSDSADCVDGLLQRCCITQPDKSPLSVEMMDAVASLMEEIDPALDINCNLVCELCDFQNSYPFDVGRYLWLEIESFAKKLLREIHILASSYGWSEQTILALTQKRRQQYLNMVMT